MQHCTLSLATAPLHYIPVSARCSLSLCPPERWRRSLLDSLSPRLAPPQSYLFISALGACSLSGIIWRHLKACVRGSSPRRGYNIAEQAVPWPAAVLGTVLSCPQHLLTFGNTGGIWLVSRPAKWSSPLCCCEPYRIRPIYPPPPHTPPAQQSLFTALISPSSFYTFLIAMALNRKLIKSLQKLQHILLLLPGSNSSRTRSRSRSRYFPVPAPAIWTVGRCMKWLPGVLTWNRSKQKRFVNKIGKRRPTYKHSKRNGNKLQLHKSDAHNCLWYKLQLVVATG